MVNKKGMEVLGLIFIVFAALFILLILGIISLGAGKVDSVLSSLDLTVGNTTWNETYQSMVAPTMEAIETTIPTNMGIALLFGMIICLVFVASKSAPRSKLWIIIDIFILIVAEVIAVIISRSFKESILNISPEFFTIFTTTLSGSSKFILNLPTIIPTAGILVMLAIYVLRQEQKEEDLEVSVYQ